MVVDDTYIRESILTPQMKLVAGYRPVMPTFQGQVNEAGLMSLIEYIKSLPSTASRQRGERAPAAARQAGQGKDHMTTTVLPRVNYLNVRHGVASWLLTKDHKRIGILYLIVVTIAFLLGGIFAAGVRIELTTPQGDFVSADTYNRLFTMHGVFMVFFVLMPVVPAMLGNFVMPLMIGAKDVAFPKINLLSWYVFVIGFIFTLAAMVSGGVDTGWTFYTPYSSSASNSNVMLTGIGIFIAGFSSILTGLNFMVTIHRMRAPGLTWFRLPLFVWALYATALVMILATPVIAITIGMLALERALGLRHLRSAPRRRPGALPAPVLVLLAPGGLHHDPAADGRDQRGDRLLLAQERVRVFVRRVLEPGDRRVRLPRVGASPVRRPASRPYSAMVFSFLSFAVAIPSAVKVFNWTATLYQGAIWWRAPMMWVFGFIGLFLIGGLTGLFLASLGLDVHLHDTYFVVAHFHYIMVGGAIMGFFAGLHYWWPKMTGRMYSN